MLTAAPLANPTPTSAVPCCPCARAQLLGTEPVRKGSRESRKDFALTNVCLLYTSDAADDM
eukprot:12319319-Alexandrium_andersonii.AAC.1